MLAGEDQARRHVSDNFARLKRMKLGDVDAAPAGRLNTDCHHHRQIRQQGAVFSTGDLRATVDDDTANVFRVRAARHRPMTSGSASSTR